MSNLKKLNYKEDLSSFKEIYGIQKEQASLGVEVEDDSILHDSKKPVVVEIPKISGDIPWTYIK